MLTATCLISSVCVEGGWEGGNCGNMNNVTRLFSVLYIAASHTIHVGYFSCVLSHFSCHIRVFVVVAVFNTLSLIFFSVNVENVGECCKAQSFV